jgi:hypothetical protein
VRRSIGASVAVATVIGFPLAVGSAVLIARSAGGHVWDEIANGLPLAIPFGAFALVGALIVARRPANLVGWVCASIGWISAMSFLGLAYGGWGLERASPPPGTFLGLWVATWSWFALLGLAIVALPLLIPDGRLVSPRWRWVAVLGCISVGGMVLLGMFSPDLFALGDETVPNPVGSSRVPSPVDPTVEGWFLASTGVAALAALASIVVRYRRGDRVERTKLKWIVYGFALMFVVSTVLDMIQNAVISSGVGDGIGNAIWALVWVMLPASIGIAVLRHRLFDIDRIVSRTVAYVIVTVMLVGLYAAGVVGLGTVVRGLTGGGGGDLVVAASTLLVAAAFGPVRRRVQAAVDRRFNRARYDAERTVRAFGQRLRDEVDLEALVDELGMVTHVTLAPRHASVWLPEPEVAP